MTTAKYFATLSYISMTEIVMIVEAFPEHELESNQISLTEQEFKLLEHLRMDLEKGKRLIASVELKIKKNKEK